VLTAGILAVLVAEEACVMAVDVEEYEDVDEAEEATRTFSDAV
jgi:hypothetical protein